MLIGLNNKNYFRQNKTMAIIFWDFDGTLAYSNHLWSTTVYNSLKEAAPNSKIALDYISLDIDEKTASNAAQLVRKNIKNINGENL